MEHPDKTNSLIVALDHPIKSEYIEEILTAIRMIKGVRKVIVNEFTHEDAMNAWSSRQEFVHEIHKIFMNAAKEK